MEARLSAEQKRAESATLRVVHSPDRAAVGRVVSLSRRGSIAFGRGSDDPRGLLVDTRLSRAHATFLFDSSANQFRVTDSGSRNGTFVDGERIDTQLLERDAVIRLGESVLVFDENERMALLLESVQRVASGALSLLLLGETGTGKEVLARHVHEQSGRAGAFVAVNCAALPREMIAAELFGHTRGAFSGATRERPGLFRSAEGGTLLLDEIGDMPLELQPALLRVLQEKKVRPVGSDQEVAVDVRVLAATHQELPEKIATGEFRADLFARLSQLTLRLPPLRARRAELLTLAGQLTARHGGNLELTAEAAEALLLWRWPLNFRELESLLAVFVHAAHGTGRLDLDFLRETKPELLEAPAQEPARTHDLSDEATSTEADLAMPASVDEASLRRVLESAQGNLAVAARELGISRQKLYRWLNQAGLDPAAFRRTFRGGAPAASDD
jgi:transcriptional regulator with GAF, ATPase, and Fis domain